MSSKRSFGERLLAAAATLGLGYLALLSWGVRSSEAQLVPLTAAALSLAHPGLGAAALLTLLSAGEPMPAVELLLAAPVAVLAFRYWRQALVWALAVLLSGRNPLGAALFGALLYSLAAAPPRVAATYAAFYALLTSFRWALMMPAGALSWKGAVIVEGLGGLSGSSELEALSAWLRTNVVGRPRLLLVTLIYAAVGAAVARGGRGVGKVAAWLVPPLIAAAAIHLQATTLGLSVGHGPTAMLAAYGALAATELRRLAARAPRALRQPPLAPSLVQPWRGLCGVLRGGGRLVVVFGPPRCGKSTVVREALRACGLPSYRRAEGREVLHIEGAEAVPELAARVEELLERGARAIVLESSRPLALLSSLQGLRVEAAVYVPPPDEESRRLIIERAAGGLLGREEVGRLARATAAYSLGALNALCDLVVKRVREGLEPERAIELALGELPGDLTPEDVLECEAFIQSFKGVVVGFYAPARRPLAATAGYPRKA